MVEEPLDFRERAIDRFKAKEMSRSGSSRNSSNSGSVTASGGAGDVFRYLIASQFSAITVFLAGALDQNAFDEVDRLVEELGRREIGGVVLDLYGITAVNADGFEAIRHLLKIFADSRIPLRMSGVRPDFRDALSERGLGIGNAAIESDVTGAVRSLAFRRFDLRADAPVMVLSNPRQKAQPTAPASSPPTASSNSTVSSPPASDSSADSKKAA